MKNNSMDLPSDNTIINAFLASISPMCQIDPKGIILGTNLEWENTFGYTNTYCIGKSFFSFLTSRNVANTGHELLESFQTEDTSQLIADFITNDDRILPYIWKIAKFKDYFLISGKESPIASNSESNHKARQNFLNQMLDAIPDFIFIKDLKGIYLGCNKAFSNRFLGKNEFDIIGKTDYEILTDKNLAEKFQADDNAVIASNMQKRMENRITMNDGSIVDIETIKTPLFDENDNFFGLIAVSRDITERNQMSQRLLRAKEDAETASKLKDQFLANMSHEIRTPMNGIFGFLQLLESTKLNTKQKEYLENMRISTNLLSSIINDILDLSKIETIGAELEEISFNLYTIAEDAIIPFTAIAFNKGLDLNLEIGKEVPYHVIGDPTRLKQVLTNLINNAIKFTEKGEVHLLLEQVQTSQESCNIRFTVRDTGIGIPDDIHNKLFKPFIQGDGSTTRRYGGTGLGLTISKSIIEAMGSEITLSSEEGVGSEFTFILTMKNDHMEQEIPFLDFSSIKDSNILLVNEFEEENRICKKYLEEKDANVTEIVSGAATIINLIENKSHMQPDMILVSQQLSDMEAYDLLATIKSIPSTKHIPVILISSRAAGFDENLELTHEFTAAIGKPFRKNEMLLTISTIMDIRNSQSDHVSDKTYGSVENDLEDYKSSKEIKHRILVVDDVQMNNKILEAALEDDYEIIVASNGKDALKIANSENQPDLILLDIMMPEMNGYEVLLKLMENMETRDIPVIFLTAISNPENEEYGLKIGAKDYIVKPFNMSIVKNKIKNHLESKKYNDFLKENSFIDQLTKIPNRRRFDESLMIEIKKARRSGMDFSLLMIDIDYFKLYNDTYGHLEGDTCLYKVAHAIRDSIMRPGDLVARWGGEEFVCLLPETENKYAIMIGERIRENVKSLAIPHEASQIGDILTVSIGVVTSNVPYDLSPSSIMQQVDDALYSAKKNGRDQVVSINDLPLFDDK